MDPLFSEGVDTNSSQAFASIAAPTFGPGARDYRINAAEQIYITNFQTLKKLMQYIVEILRNALSISAFGFQTTK
jgi:hypothetical protein